MKSIKQVLMERDGLSESEAEELIEECKDDLYDRLSHGELPYHICEEYFGLDPDYLDDLI